MRVCLVCTYIAHTFLVKPVRLSSYSVEFVLSGPVLSSPVLSCQALPCRPGPSRASGLSRHTRDGLAVKRLEGSDFPSLCLCLPGSVPLLLHGRCALFETAIFQFHATGGPGESLVVAASSTHLGTPNSTSTCRQRASNSVQRLADRQQCAAACQPAVPASSANGHGTQSATIAWASPRSSRDGRFQAVVGVLRGLPFR